MTPQAPYYELRDLITVAALAGLLAYLAGRAHAERAAHRARERRRAYRLSRSNQNPTTKKEG
jgi:uncharacterized membrane protein